MEIRILSALTALSALLGATCVRAEAIKTFPLDDQEVYHLKVSTDKVTTVTFPQVITDIEGSGVTNDLKLPAKMLLSYHPGARFFSIRALRDDSEASLNIICGRFVYILEFATDKEPFQSVRFYLANETPVGAMSSRQGANPRHLLGLLDKAKAYPVLAAQYPEMASQIEQDTPNTRSLYCGFDVVLARVFRFDSDDTLIFEIELVNHSVQPVSYLHQSLGVRVGPSVYWSALSDASGIIPAGVKTTGGQIDEGHSFAWFVICGTSQGRRNYLSVHNAFNVLVFRPQPREIQ